MAFSEELSEYLLELFEPLDDVSIRRMFGGAGVFCYGVMFGLIAGDQLYFKIDDENKAMFEEAGCEPFTYGAKNGKRGVMSYYEAPESLYDDSDEMLIWARSALEAALRNAKLKKSKKRKLA